MYVNDNNVIYLDSFGLNKFQNKFKNSQETKHTIKSIYRIQAFDSIICGYIFIGFIDFMLKCKSLLDYKNLFSPYNYENNDEIILKNILTTKKIKKLHRLICGKYRKFDKAKISYIFQKTLVPSILCSRCKKEDETIFTEEDSIEILKSLSLIEKI